MMDGTTLRGIIRNLDTYVGQLRDLGRLPRDQVLADYTKTGAIRYFLHVAIECCLDAANHIIAVRSLRAPADYADAFAVLGEASVVPTEFVPTLQQMARLRNRLVHLYWNVDDATLYEILQTDLGDFDRSRACVVAQIQP